MDVWTHEYESFGGAVRRDDCPACVQRRFDFLNAQMGTTSSSLCGRNAVQVSVNSVQSLDLARVEQQLAPVADSVKRNEFLVKATIADYELTIFPDNRAIIQGTDDISLAKTLYARYIGA